MTEEQIQMILKVLHAEQECLTSVLKFDADVLSVHDEAELQDELIIVNECIEAMRNG